LNIPKAELVWLGLFVVCLAPRFVWRLDVYNPQALAKARKLRS